MGLFSTSSSSKRKCFLFLGLFLSAFFLKAQSDHGTIQGIVRDSSEEAVPYANIGISELGRGTSSNEEGEFRMEGLPPGSYRIKVSKVGFRGSSKKIQVQAGDTTELEVFLTRGGIEMAPISITGSAEPKDPMRSPNEVEVWEGTRKKEEEAASLGETVENAPGVDQVSTGPQSGKPVIRGLSGNRVRTLHDGVAMEHQQFGVRHMPNVDPFVYERIELKQGPSSVLYGSEAMAGVIDLKPHSIPRTDSSELQFEGEAIGRYHRNNRQWASGLRLKGGKGGFGANAAFIRRSAGNMRTPDVVTYSETGKTGDPKFSGELDHTDFDQLNGSFGAGYRADDWELQARYTRWSNEQNVLLPNGKGLGQRLSNDAFELDGRIVLSERWELEPSVTHLINRRISNPKGAPRSELPTESFGHLDLRSEKHVDHVMARHRGDQLSGRIGAEYVFLDQRSQGVGEPLVPSGRIENYALFALEEYRVGDLDLIGGVRFDDRRQRAVANEKLRLPDRSRGEDGSVLKQRYRIFSGSFGVNYSFTKKFAISSSVGRGFRAPNFFDLHANGIHGGVAAFQRGNPYLRPEYSLNTDLSVKYASKKLEGRITGYRNRISGYIHLRNVDEPDDWNGPPLQENVQSDALLHGFHASIHAELLKGLHIKASSQVVEGREMGSGNELPLMPANKLRGELRYRWSGSGIFEHFHIKGGLRHAFPKEAAGRYEPFWQFENLPQFGFGTASTEAYTLFHAGIGGDFRLWEKAIAVRIEVKNLSNEAYRDFLDTYKGYALGMGRDFRFELRVPF